MLCENRNEAFLKKNFPDATDMFNAFRDLIKKWADLPVKYIGIPALGPSVMSLERSVYFSAHVKGMLNMRCHQKFGQILADSVMVHNSGHLPVSKEDAFQVVVDQFCAVLMSARNAQGYRAHPSSPSNPNFWPRQKPQAACALLVDRFPVEIRFWVEEGETLREVVNSQDGKA